MPKFYITTPVYYTNDKPHIGHTYTTVAADVLARYHRLTGNKTFFLTGTDEHGANIQAKAEEAGFEPRQFVDQIVKSFKMTWSQFDISNDNFIRTTDQAHIKAVQKALEQMYKKGDIFLGKYEGLYCRGCEQFKNERDLVGGLCQEHQVTPQMVSEQCYTFKLSKYQDRLLKLIKSDKLKILPAERKNEVISFYEKEGLKDVSFSRKFVKWGIPIPWDKTQTIYVWADAFLNYLTGLGWDGSPAPLVKGGQGGLNFWPPDVQLMSKDILRVHASIWPAMLLSLGLPLPKQIFIHGYFLIDSQKMSKSLGNVISPEDLIKKYEVDGARYLLMSAAPFGRDADINWQKFDEKYNADLANGLGNLVARVSNLLEKNDISVKTNSRSSLPKTGKLFKQFQDEIKNFRLDEALKILWQALKKNDEILSREKPWKLEDKNKIKKILEPITQNILDISLMLKPFMPDTADKLIKQFSEKQIRKGEPLFPRI